MINLKYQTREQFLGRLAAKTEDATGDELVRLLAFINRGEFTDTEMIRAFSINISTWDRIKGIMGFSPTQLAELKARARAAADAKAVLDGVRGE